MNNNKHKISICMMVKDEEKNIKRCLNSLIPLTESGLAELIIVDTGSTDSTVEIAREYTDRIYYHEWNNNFSDMRNISISYARGEWIFIIDADEELENPEKVLSLFNEANINKNNAIIIQVKNLTSLENKDKTALNPSPRFFKNDGDFRYVGSVHNQPKYKEPIYVCDISLMHYGYIMSDKILMEKKFERTKGLLFDELSKNPENVYYQFQLGVTYDMHGNKKEALREFNKAYNLLSLKNAKEKFNYMYIYAAYARSAFTNNKHDEVIRICEEGIKIREDYIDLYYLLASSKMVLNEYKYAKNTYLKYLEFIDKYSELPISKELSISLYHIDETCKNSSYYNLCLCYLEEKDFISADKMCDLLSDKIKIAYIKLKTFLGLKDYQALVSFYNSQEENTRKYFLMILEQEILKLNDDEVFEIYNRFSKCKDIYGLYSKIKCRDKENINISFKEFMSYSDLNNLDNYYFSILPLFYEERRSVISLLKKLGTRKLIDVIRYLLEKHVESFDFFLDYLKTENVRPTDPQSNRVYVYIASFVLVNYLNTSEIIEDTYYNIFISYLEKGMNYVKEIYRAEKFRIIYKEVNNEEDKFFILMSIFDDYMKNNDFKYAFKYLLEAINTNSTFVRYLDLYRNNLLSLMNKGD